MADIKSASQTCNSWYHASCDPRITERIMLNFSYEPDDNLDIFVRPVSCFRFDSVNFEKFDYKKLLRSLGEKITKLHIYFCSRLRITQLFEMFLYVPNLKVLQLEYGKRYFKINNFYEHGRIKRQKDRILKILGQLQELHIRTEEKQLKGAEILLNYCSGVRRLYWNENNFQKKSDEFSCNILVNPDCNCTFECLESLTVHSIDRKQNSKFFESLVQLNRISLRKINLREISDLYYDAHFKEFCKTYKALDTLILDGCNDQHLVDICQNMVGLKILDLDNVTATKFSHISYLNNLENLKVRRTDSTSDEGLIELLHKNLINITSLTLNNIARALLNEICENLPQLKRLRLEYIETNECDPIFRHLRNLEQIHLEFAQPNRINSSEIVSDPEWNVMKLIELKDLYVNTFAPGFTPDLIRKLPKLTTKHHEYISDFPDDAEVENCVVYSDYNVEVDEAACDNLGYERGLTQEKSEEIADTREYDLTEFNFFYMRFYKLDKKVK